MRKNVRLLITGANGFTGRHACIYFSQQGMQVIPMFHSRSIEDPNSVVCDLTNKMAVMSLIKNIQPDYVLHLAGQNSVLESWKKPLDSLEINILGTSYLLEAIRQEVPNCKILILGSALQHDLTKNAIPPHPYSLSKTIQAIIADAWGELMGVNIVIAKPSNLIGPGKSTGICSLIGKKLVDIEVGKCEPTIEINNLQDTRDFLDVRDAVAAYHVLLCDGEKGKKYDIGSGIKHSLLEVLEEYKKITNLEFQIRETHRVSSKGQSDLVLQDIKKYGWSPKVKFTDSLQDVWGYMRKNRS
ncbi:NAD-dependent epimerase/dehydratase family protein [Bacillus thuringiensis]|uniref:NAD-dependent epimerase/dehydratase family protein n=1 Tax=Bacillus thuringiensis TaxID=1428 RepID=UPI0026E48D6A|nr:NAD-dependent epimerase/dehydratase family protein [Bacillus thuringiensis]MDO6632238.1 GDP-mannose 4,6-dehydratase [Bacillus thuringiensis]MDO6661741.1 GDP-mannose 4,6-dehydratase [Bacillus thuringiensis]MDO6702487.1 GDP-mannose 4,6-dehydratase [Bacillus thuringiensis]